MSNLRIVVAAAAACVFSAGPAAAQYDTNTSTQLVSFEVEAVNQIVMSGLPSLVISGAPVTGDTLAIATANASYAVTTNESSKKITAELDQDMPAGLTLWVSLGQPTGASSAGAQVLSTTAADVVTDIAEVSESNLSVLYTLKATLGAGPVAAASRTVTFTIIDG
jgi:hypothetical protein